MLLLVTTQPWTVKYCIVYDKAEAILLQMSSVVPLSGLGASGAPVMVQI